MLSVRLICVGRLKERHYIDACREYEKRLAAFCRCEVRELEESGDLNAEGRAVQAAIQKGAYRAALCIEGEQTSSEQLAHSLNRLMNGGVSRLDLIIGGSNGLSEEIKYLCDARLSMSRMTFPHHLARVMALEQLYRALSILNGGKYHK